MGPQSRVGLWSFGINRCCARRRTHIIFAGKDLGTAGEKHSLASLISGSPPSVNTLTMREYLARSRWRQLLYRLYRHPIVMFGVGPAYLFILRIFLSCGARGSAEGPR
jgi:hypothetical protein